VLPWERISPGSPIVSGVKDFPGLFKPSTRSTPWERAREKAKERIKRQMILIETGIFLREL
jgi:hypothetical protein